MDGISDIRYALKFDATQYAAFMQQASSEKADVSTLDTLLLAAVNSGKEFGEALTLVQQDLPALAQPNVTGTTQLNGWAAIPSPGALIMSVTTQYAAEQRKENQQVMWAQTEAIAQSMKDEATKMREAAVTQLILGCVSGAINIGMGFAQVGMGAMAAKNAARAADSITRPAGDAAAKAANTAINQSMGLTAEQVAARATAAADRITNQATEAAAAAANHAMTKANIGIGAVGQMTGGVSKIVDSAAQYVGERARAVMKEMEADQEKMRAVRESIKDLNDALRDLIQKSLAAQNDIQASTNQARTRILA